MLIMKSTHTCQIYYEKNRVSQIQINTQTTENHLNVGVQELTDFVAYLK